MTESAYHDALNKVSRFTTTELDDELERTARTSETCEMLLCCYLAAMRERGGFREFGYSNIYDYANARFGFGPRKTRYLVALGRKIEALPQIREALANGKLGWTKAARVAAVATSENEAMWLESALALTVRDLERRIHDGTDAPATILHLPLNEDRHILWENVLELYRRRAGAEISPVEVFEYLLAEAVATHGYVGPAEDESQEDADEQPGDPDERDEPTTLVHDTLDANAGETPLFPWAEPVTRENTWSSERDAETAFATSADYSAVRRDVLERDGWRCMYPGCEARKNLEVHHVRFRSRGGTDEPSNLAVVCHFHHAMIHAEQIALSGRAPLSLEWTPPKLMREVLERRRNNPSKWIGELDIREWTLDPAPTTG